MLRFRVEGMNCGHCVEAVTRAVRGVEPNAGVEADLGTGELRVRSAVAPGDVADRVATAVRAAGYDLTAASAVAPNGLRG